MTILQTLDEAAAHLSGERVLSRVEREELADFVVEARAAVAEMVEAARYARLVVDQLSEKAAGRGDRDYCARILKEGNIIDAALAKFGGAR